MVPPEPKTVVEKSSSTSVDAEEQLVSSTVSSAGVCDASSLRSPKGAQEEDNFMGKGGEQQFIYQPNVYASQPQTLFPGGYVNHLGLLEEYPHFASAEGLDAAIPVMYGAYAPVPTIGDSQAHYYLHYPLSSPYYQPPPFPSMVYSNSATGISQFDPMHQYYLPDELLYPQTPGFHHQPFGSFDGAVMQWSGIPGFFGQGNLPLTSGMHQESTYSPGSYKAHQQGGKFGGPTRRWGFKHEKSSLDFLNEQNCGPRTTKTKKEEEISSAGDKNKKRIVDSEQYNDPEFSTEYKNAKFFVIKSYTEDHVHKSIKYNVWASTATGNRKLNVAYHAAKQIENHCPVFLFFSVNGSGQFCGVAEMIGPVDFDRSVDYWQHDRWSGQFPVKWHIVKDVPNNLVRHIILDNNENKPVTNSKDTQEVKLEQGLWILTIFKNHEAETTILEDFDFYERREKAMLDNRHQKKLQPADAEAQKIVESSAPVDLVTHISATFAQAVQLEETKGDRPKVEDTVVAENASAVHVRTEEAMAEEGSPSRESS